MSLSSIEVQASNDIKIVKDEYAKLAAASYSLGKVALYVGIALVVGLLVGKI